jgi:hypothetical protein
MLRNIALVEPKLLTIGVSNDIRTRIPYLGILWTEEDYNDARNKTRQHLEKQLESCYRQGVDMGPWCALSLPNHPVCTIVDHYVAVKIWKNATVGVFRCLSPPWTWSGGLQHATRGSAEDACLSILMQNHIRPLMTQSMSRIDVHRVRQGPLRIDDQCYIWVSNEVPLFHLHSSQKIFSPLHD